MYNLISGASYYYAPPNHSGSICLNRIISNNHVRTYNLLVSLEMFKKESNLSISFLTGCEVMPAPRSNPRPADGSSESNGRPPRPATTHVEASSLRFDCMANSQPAMSTGAQVMDIRPPSRMMAERPATVYARNEGSSSQNSGALEDIKERIISTTSSLQEVEKLAGTDIPTTSNDDLTLSSDVEGSSEMTHSCFSNSSAGSKGTSKIST